MVRLAKVKSAHQFPRVITITLADWQAVPSLDLVLFVDC